MNDTEIIENEAWLQVSVSEKSNDGKWMIFFDFKYKDTYLEIMQDITSKKICTAKISKIPDKFNRGVLVLFSSSSDLSENKQIIEYLLKNNVVSRMKNGKYRNMSFKLNSQTRAGKYGKNENAVLHLSDFIDLETGKMKENDNE